MTWTHWCVFGSYEGGEKVSRCKKASESTDQDERDYAELEGWEWIVEDAEDAVTIYGVYKSEAEAKSNASVQEPSP